MKLARAWMAVGLVVVGCGGSSGESEELRPGPPLVDAAAPPPALDAGAPAPPAAPDAGQRFAALDAFLDEQLKTGTSGFAMQVYDAEDRVVYQRESGTCATPPACPPNAPPFKVDLATGIASSSKWLTSSTVLAVIQDQVAAGKAPSLEAALDVKVAPILGCPGVTGPVTGITMRQLLSFTSGVIPDGACINDPTTTLQLCACEILTQSAANMQASTEGAASKDKAFPPGTSYIYGASHHAIAGAVVEKLTGKAWSTVFQEKINAKLGTSMVYKNPKNLAGSVDATIVDYARFVGAVFHDGQGTAAPRILTKEAVAAQRADQVAPTVKVFNSPQPGFEYGLNTWRWCYAPFTLADMADPLKLVSMPSCGAVFQSGHGGKGGYAPFLDVGGKYYAVFAAREKSGGGGADYTNAELGLTLAVRLHTHLAMTTP